MSSEEFFMYLTIGLILLVPIGARLYRYFAVARMKRTLHEQFAKPEQATQSDQKR